MGHQTRRTLAILFILVLFYLNPYILGKSEEKDNAFDLSLILEKAANYCQKLDKTSLHFVCHIRPYRAFGQKSAITLCV